MRLLYIYIEDFGILKDAQINFTDRFTFNYDKETQIVSWTKNEVPLPENFFSIDRSNNAVQAVSAIVGENGSGKTSVAKAIYTQNYMLSFSCFLILEGDHEIYVKNALKTKDYKPPNGASISDVEVSFFPELSLTNIRNQNYTFVYCSNFYSTQHEIQSTENIYDLSTSNLIKEDLRFYNLHYQTNLGEVSIQNPLIAHEFIELNRIANFLSTNKVKEMPTPRKVTISLIDTDYKPLIKSLEYEQKNGIKHSGLEKTILLLFMKLNKVKNKTYFDDFLHKFIKSFLGNWLRYNFELQKDDYDQELESSLTKIIGKIGSTAVYDEFEEFLTIPLLISYDRGNFETAKELFRILRKREMSLSFFINLNEGGLKDFNEISHFYFQCYTITHFMNFAWTGLSSGEMAQLSIFSRLYDFKIESEKKNSATKDLIVFLDEVEITIHPDLQRKLVSNLIEFFELHFVGYKVHLIFASHSPVLISDIPKSNVVFMRKYEVGEKKGLCEIVEHDKIVTNPFASNIHSLYKNSFFTNGTMGTFSENKIKNVITYIKDDDISIISSAEDAQQIIDIIGEPIIYHKLQNMLDRNEKKEKSIDEQIADLMERKGLQNDSTST
jgi:AAA15 family ATPase/GTPase